MKKIGLIDKAFLLKRTPLFQTLDLDLVLQCAEKAGSIAYAPQEVLFHFGEEGHRMFFVAHGEILLESMEGERLFAHSLSFFGEESLFSGKPRAYRAISATDSLLVTFTKNRLLHILSECPQVAMGFLANYAQESPFPKKRGLLG